MKFTGSEAIKEIIMLNNKARHASTCQVTL